MILFPVYKMVGSNEVGVDTTMEQSCSIASQVLHPNGQHRTDNLSRVGSFSAHTFEFKTPGIHQSASDNWLIYKFRITAAMRRNIILLQVWYK